MTPDPQSQYRARPPPVSQRDLAHGAEQAPSRDANIVHHTEAGINDAGILVMLDM
jgi:hypothetical protein